MRCGKVLQLARGKGVAASPSCPTRSFSVSIHSKGDKGGVFRKYWFYWSCGRGYAGTPTRCKEAGCHPDCRVKWLIMRDLEKDDFCDLVERGGGEVWSWYRERYAAVNTKQLTIMFTECK